MRVLSGDAAIPDETLLALPDDAASPHVSEVEQLVLAYADGITRGVIVPWSGALLDVAVFAFAV